MTTPRRKALTVALADFALANGATLAAADAGSPNRPQRITTEQDLVIDGTAISTVKGLCFFDHATYGNDCVFVSFNGTVKGYDASGTEILSASASSGYGVYRKSSSLIWVARVTGTFTGYHEIDLVAGTITLRTLTGMSASARRMVFIVPGGAADRGWAASGSTDIAEFTVSTLAATGRKITAIANVVSVYPGNLPGTSTPGIFVLTNSGTTSTVTFYDEATLTLGTQWVTNGAQGLPGGTNGTCIAIEPVTGQPMLWTVTGDWVLLNASGGSQVGQANIYLWSDPYRGPSPDVSVTSQGWGMLDFSRRYVAFVCPGTDGLTQSRVVRRVNIQDQTATADYVTTEAGTLNDLDLVGQLGRSLGISDIGYRSGTTVDHRRVRATYQRLTVDGSPVQFTPGADLSGVTFDAGITIRIVITFTAEVLRPFESYPYVQAVNGNYTIDEATNTDQSTPPDSTSTTTITVIRDHCFELIRALVPGEHSDRTFDHVSQVSVEEWAANGAATSELFRKFEWRGGDVEDGPLMAIDRVERLETVVLTIYYPVLPELYGVDRLDDLEAIIRADARKVRDVLFAPTNYIAGCVAIPVVIGQPTRSGSLYVMQITLTVDYFEAQSLYPQ